MDGHEHSRIRTRGTILVASGNDLFSAIVREMVVDSGFAPAAPAASEPAWLTLTRTQPCIVICDCDAPAATTQALIAEASARGIPLVMSEQHAEHHIERALTLARVAWLRFPVSHEAFCVMLDALLPTTVHSFHRVSARGIGLSMEAAYGVRALVGQWPRFAGSGRQVLARIGHTDGLDNERADDDGMPMVAE
jgi:DNA-binding NtrC family response regulator